MTIPRFHLKRFLFCFFQDALEENQLLCVTTAAVKS